jgi:hypothetical protein
VSASGNLGGNSKGVTKMSPGSGPSEGVYCLTIPGTLHVAVATANSLGGGTVRSVFAVDMAPLIEMLSNSCAKGTTVAVHTWNLTGESDEVRFFLLLD